MGGRASRVDAGGRCHTRMRFSASVFSPPWEFPRDDTIAAQSFAAGDRLPVGVEAFPGMEPNDLVLWIESRRALVSGDTLIDRGRGFEFPADWANKGYPAGADPRDAPSAARTAGRVRAPDARSADRPSRPRTRSFLTPPAATAWSQCRGRESNPHAPKGTPRDSEREEGGARRSGPFLESCRSAGGLVNLDVASGQCPGGAVTV